jgi:hypothetical protein
MAVKTLIIYDRYMSKGLFISIICLFGLNGYICDSDYSSYLSERFVDRSSGMFLGQCGLGKKDGRLQCWK